MKAILQKDVTNLGREGDVVKVTPGFFRNFLAPRNLARFASPSNLKELEFKKKRIEAVRAKMRGEAQELAKKLNAVAVEIRHRCGEKGQLFGAVTATDIAESLLKAGYEVDRRKVVISDPIKAIGQHEVAIRVYPEVTAKIAVTVRPEADQEAEIMEILSRAERERKAAEEAARKAAAAAEAQATEAPAEGEEAPAAEAEEKPKRAPRKKKGDA